MERDPDKLLLEFVFLDECKSMVLAAGGGRSLMPRSAEWRF